MANKTRHCAVTAANALHDSRKARAELAKAGYAATYWRGHWVIDGNHHFATARDAVKTLIGERK